MERQFNKAQQKSKAAFNGGPSSEPDPSSQMDVMAVSHHLPSGISCFSSGGICDLPPSSLGLSRGILLCLPDVSTVASVIPPLPQWWQPETTFTQTAVGLCMEEEQLPSNQLDLQTMLSTALSLWQLVFSMRPRYHLKPCLHSPKFRGI